MTVATAFVDGWRRVLRAPMLIAGLWLASVATALPFALLVRDLIADHLGTSLAAEAAASGVNFDWWNEFLAQASGLGQTFTPSILGFAAVLRNMSTLADGNVLPRPLALIVAGSLLLSLFLLGGILDRLARDRAIGSHGFFAACGVYFFRFLRLGVLAGAAYVVLFSVLHPWLFEAVLPEWSREVTSERTAFAMRLSAYGLFAALLAAVNVVADYAKIRMVVEDRRSAVGAVMAALRFVRRSPGAALGLYALNTLVFVLVLAAYALLAPRVGSGYADVAMVLAIGQLYVVLRVLVRLAFAATQIALFQGRYAHAGYVARVVSRWPDSPAAEHLS